MSDELDDDLDELEYRPRSALVGIILPLVTALVATGVGLVIGAAATWVLVSGSGPPDPPEVVKVARDLTQEEIAAVCAPFIEEATTRVEAADHKVKGLEAQVVAKERRVTELEEEMVRRGKRGAQLVREIEQAKAELVTLQGQLEQAIEEKEQVVAELKQTKIELEDQKVETHVAKEDALDFKWRDFIGSAQLDICERGNRKKLGRCRETIDAMFGPALREKFAHCVRSNQAIPSVRQIGKDEALPQFAAFIDQDDKITRDWYVLLCDPTLPEAEGLGNPVSAEPSGMFDDFDDLPDDFEDLDD